MKHRDMLELGLVTMNRGKYDAYCISLSPLPATSRGISMSKRGGNLISLRSWTWSMWSFCLCELTQEGYSWGWGGGQTLEIEEKPSVCLSSALRTERAWVWSLVCRVYNQNLDIPEPCLFILKILSPHFTETRDLRHQMLPGYRGANTPELGLGLPQISKTDAGDNSPVPSVIPPVELWGWWCLELVKIQLTGSLATYQLQQFPSCVLSMVF